MSTTIKYGFQHKSGFRRPKTKLDDLPPPRYLKPYPHQTQFVAELQAHPCWIVIGPPAAGKSLTTAALATLKARQNRRLKVIIAVPQKIIGAGYENCRFELPQIGNVDFIPNTKLHDSTDNASTTAQLRRFLTRTPRTPVNDRTCICTHQALVLAYKQFPELFEEVLVVVDECHHSKAEETAEGDVIANCLGYVVTDLTKRGQQVGLTTATATRADGHGLMGQYKDRFVVAECPFDDYLRVCRDFRSFTFNFALYEEEKDGLAKMVNQLLGNRRSRPHKTIVHIPYVNSAYSRGKGRDVRSVLRGISGCSEGDPVGPLIKNESGAGTGITLVKRGRYWIRVINLVDKQDRDLKQRIIVDAHDDPDKHRIDVIIALNMFREGANWRWAERSLIVGHRSSLPDLLQMTGRALRDAPGKASADIFYCLCCREQDIKQNTNDTLNDFLKGLLFGLLLEDVFHPVEIRVTDPKTKKRRRVKTDLLTEALQYDLQEKQRIEDLIIQELRQHDQLDQQQSVKIATETLQDCGVQHERAAVKDIARQIVQSHYRRTETVLQKLEQDVTQLSVGGVDVDLLRSSRHPLAYLVYYTDGIGIGTLGELREALQGERDRLWWEWYALLVRFVTEYGKIPVYNEIYAKRELGKWVVGQRSNRLRHGINREKIVSLEAVPGWTWTILETKWAHMYHQVVTWVERHGEVPTTTDRRAKTLGAWCNRQRVNYKKGSLSVNRIKRLEVIPGWLWDVFSTRWATTFRKVVEWTEENNCLPALGLTATPDEGARTAEERRLGNWCGTQRTLYSEGNLRADRVDQLQSIAGWEWNTFVARRDFVLNEVIAWVENHGRLPMKVKDGTTEEGRLGSWCVRVRQHYFKGILTGAQIEKLEALPGWRWKIDRWGVSYESLVAWVQEHKRLPRKTSGPERCLGNFCAQQRTKYRKNTLPVERIKKLEGIPGWWWKRKDKPTAPPADRYTTDQKVHARHDTIIQQYQRIFGPQLPEQQQYWTMPAQCIDDGEPLPNSELHQMVKVGLIEPQQFHGVDLNEDVFEANCRYRYAHWYCGDFYDAVSEEVDLGDDFNPGIVNVDTISEPKNGIDLFCRVLERLKNYRNCLFVGNFILRNRGRRHHAEELLQRLKRHPKFQSVQPTLQWDNQRLLYTYDGATPGHTTTMGTVMLWRK